MAAEAEQSEAPLVQLSLLEGCEEAVPAPQAIAVVSRKVARLDELKAEHRQLLEAAAIDEERIRGWRTLTTVEQLSPEFSSWGTKVLPAMATEWLTVSGQKVPQLRLDNPVRKKDGSTIRYLFPEGSGGLVGTDAAFREHWQSSTAPMLLVEGTKQFQAVASTINPAHPITVPFGIAGCWGWSREFKPGPDLLALPAEGRDVFIGFDADLTNNWLVWEAGRRLAAYLTQELLARSVRFLLIPGTGEGKDGLDDFLGRQPTPERRLSRLRHLLDTAVELKTIKQPPKPTKGSGFFDRNSFLSADCWRFLQSQHHLAMAEDVSVAVYHQGVYWNGTSLWWSRLISGTLGNDYRPEFEHNLTKVAMAWLKTEQRIIPFQQPQPVLNFKNCLLDARTLKQGKHTPEHLTLVQLPHAWDPKAECPTFLKWIEQVAPGQLESLLDVCSQMLDLSEWPRLIVFLTGPTRSGKSTWIRILNALVGQHLRSNVSLHDLSRSDDKFATSSLFGKVLNTFADLSANDLQDLSMVKVLTGGDEFEAQRKNGHRFTMRNQAMLVFSANSIPATSENSGAFLARVAHFEFPFSFEGKEDKTLEDRMVATELPGILRLMVEALHERKLRGNFLPLDQTRQQAFAEKTDRVRMFLKERTHPGGRSSRCIKRSELFELFNDWLEEEHGGAKRYGLGKQKFNERVRLAGIDEFKPEGGAWAWNLLKLDPETAEVAPSKTAEPPSSPSVGTTPSRAGGSPAGQKGTQEPKLPSKTAEGKKQVRAKDFKESTSTSSAVSAVSPYRPTSHPLSEPDAKPLRWVKTAETAEPQIPVKAADPTPFVGTPPAGVTYIAAADQLPTVASIPKAIGFDIETFNRRTDLWRHKASLSPSLGGEIRLAQISTGDTEPTLVIDVAMIGQPALDWLAQIVHTPERVVVGHNLLFEATFLIAAGIRPLCRWWDTMLASQLVGDLSSNSLASVAKYYLGREIDKGEQLSNWGSELTASQLAYAALDAVVVRPLAKRLREELQATGQELAHRLDCQMISPCADGQVRGLAVDLQMVAVAREHATAERDQKVAAVQQMLGLENYRNAVKLRDALIEHTGQPLPNAQGATLERYRGFPAVDLLLEIKELDTELKEITWLEQEQALTDGRIRPTYKILGARTGRTTTSALVPSSKQSVPSDTEVFGPNAQKAGQPKPVKLGQLGFNFQGLTGDRKKALSTGNPDTVLIDLDWSSIEVRLQASPRLYNDEGQRKILLEGIDPHAYIASQVCGRQITKADPERSTIGKTANFSLAYGCGVKNLARQLELAQGKPVSYGQAEKVYKAWHRFHPQISQLMARFDDGTRITESRSLSGRRMTVRGKTLDNNSRLPLEHLGRTNGINFPIQGSGRDLLADALGDLWPALEAFPGTRVVGLIHDEILLEVPRQHVEAVKAVALEAMTSQRLQDAYLGDIPLEADASVGETWGEVH